MRPSPKLSSEKSAQWVIYRVALTANSQTDAVIDDIDSRDAKRGRTLQHIARAYSPDHHFPSKFTGAIGFYRLGPSGELEEGAQSYRCRLVGATPLELSFHLFHHLSLSREIEKPSARLLSLSSHVGMDASLQKDTNPMEPSNSPSPPVDKAADDGATAALSKDAASQLPDVRRDSQDRLVVTYRSDRSLRMSLLMHVLRPFKPRAVASSKVFSAGSQRLKPSKFAVKSCVWKERCVGNQWIYDLTPKSTAETPSPVDGDGVEHSNKRVYYFCGGSWSQPPSFVHFRFLSELARRMPKTKVTVISHPLAPKAPASVAVPQIASLYESLMEESFSKGEKVIWAGESSGGNIALCQVLMSLTKGATHKPSAILAICPSTDLRHLDPAINEVSKLDPLMTIPFIGSTGRMWASGPDRVLDQQEKSSIPNAADYSTIDPRVSPIMARLEVLAENNVKVHGVTGSYDVLAPEAVYFRERCKEVGIEGEWLEWNKQMHCFHMPYGVFRESTEAMEWIVDVLQRT